MKETPRLINILQAELSVENKEKIKKSAEKTLKSKAVKNDAEKAKAAVAIQRGFRRFRFHRKMDENAYETALHLYSDPKDKTLSHYMFGKTNAIYAKKEELSFLPVNPYVGQVVSSEIGYYRTDPLSSMESLTDIIKAYDSNADEAQYDYIPITLSTVLSVEDIVKTYTPEFKNKIKILHHPTDKDTLLAFIKIDKNDSSFFQLKKILTTLGIYSGNFIAKVASLGIKSSHWQVALQRPQLSESVKGVNLSYRPLPKTVTELKNSSMVSKIRQISHQKDIPTQHLAATLLQLIDNIKDTDPVNEEALKRMAIFIDLAGHLYERNYNRFSFSLYCVIHELTLLLNKKEISIDYQEFLKESHRSTAQIFGLPEDLRYIALPANSGTNALMLALNIAKKANKKSCIRTEGPLYFEFDRLNLAQVTTDEADHDIYLITGGPTVWLGIYPGIDLNRVIRARIDSKNMNPMTLIVDSTSGMHKKLKIDDDLKPYILNGTISIIVNESHQKFGLGHSDQAQHGYVFGVCSNHIYSKALLDEVEASTEKDLQKNIDMQIGTYLTLHAEKPLEQIKEAHFSNGALLRKLLSEMGLAEDNMLPEDNSFDDSERGLFVYVNSLSLVAKVIRKHFECRDSFGHFNTTWCECGPFTRLAVSASDKIDVYIEASEIYFASFYSKEKMVTELSAFVSEKMLKKNVENLSTAEQVQFIGLMQTLMHLNHKPKDLIEQFEWNLAIKYMRERCPDLVGRKSYQAILERQERQFQKLESGPHHFADIVIHKLTRKNFSNERAAVLLSLLNDYKKAETSKKGRKQLPALQAAIVLCGCDLLKVELIQEMKTVLFSNDGFAKAIMALDQLKLLKDLYPTLNNGLLQPERYTAIYSYNPRDRETCKEIITHIANEQSGDFAKAVTLLHDSQSLLEKIESRIKSFKATAEEKEKLSPLIADLKQLINPLEKNITQCQIPTIEQSNLENMQLHFNEYISFAQTSRSNILKIMAIALRHFIQEVLHFSKSSGPSRVEVKEETQNIVKKFSLFSQKNKENAEVEPNNTIKPDSQ